MIEEKITTPVEEIIRVLPAYIQASSPPPVLPIPLMPCIYMPGVNNILPRPGLLHQVRDGAATLIDLGPLIRLPAVRLDDEKIVDHRPKKLHAPRKPLQWPSKHIKLAALHKPHSPMNLPPVTPLKSKKP